MQNYEKKNLASNPRIAIQFILYRLYSRMEEYLHDKNEKSHTMVLQYENVIKFDEELITLKG